MTVSNYETAGRFHLDRTFFETSTNGWWWASTAGRGEQGLRDREREGERGSRSASGALRVRQVRTCALAICPALRAPPPAESFVVAVGSAASACER